MPEPCEEVDNIPNYACLLTRSNGGSPETHYHLAPTRTTCACTRYRTSRGWHAMTIIATWEMQCIMLWCRTSSALSGGSRVQWVVQRRASSARSL